MVELDAKPLPEFIHSVTVTVSVNAAGVGGWLPADAF